MCVLCATPALLHIDTNLVWVARQSPPLLDTPVIDCECFSYAIINGSTLHGSLCSCFCLRSLVNELQSTRPASRAHARTHTVAAHISHPLDRSRSHARTLTRRRGSLTTHRRSRCEATHVPRAPAPLEFTNSNPLTPIRHPLPV